MLTNLIHLAAFLLVGYLLLVLSHARTPDNPARLRVRSVPAEGKHRR